MNGLRSNFSRCLRSFAVVRRRSSSMAKTFNYSGMERWKGRVAIVTGASAGIGYETAKRLAQLGVVVVGCARNSKSIKVSFCARARVCCNGESGSFLVVIIASLCGCGYPLALFRDASPGSSPATSERACRQTKINELGLRQT